MIPVDITGVRWSERSLMTRILETFRLYEAWYDGKAEEQRG